MSEDSSDARTADATADEVAADATADDVTADVTADDVTGHTVAEPLDDEGAANVRSSQEDDLDDPAVVDEDAAGDLVRIDRLSTLLDESIELPGGYRIGIDPIVGVLPVVGDLFASAVSVYIVMEAAYLGVPRATLARMILNVVVDTVFGSIPVVGPVFDALFKANARNAALLEQRLEHPTDARADRRVLLVLGVAFAALGVVFAVATGAATLWVLGEVGLL